MTKCWSRDGGGINYNNVWAALGIPVNVIAARNKGGEPEDFHIGGSDASGIVYKVGKDVTNVKVGDEVVMHCGQWNRNCEWVKNGGDPMYSPSLPIWGYETNLRQLCPVHPGAGPPVHAQTKAHDLGRVGAYTLVAATAWRMLHGWGAELDQEGRRGTDLGRRRRPRFDGDPDRQGGRRDLGGRRFGEDKFDYCMKLGAKGCINRNEFDHWGMLPHWKDNAGYAKWLKGVRAFGAKIWEVLGEKRAPNVVFEHPGETTIPTSIFVCETGGMVVVCAGTTGYNATVDLRYLWMRQKRLQGSHFANAVQSNEMNQLALRGQLDPCMSRAFTYEELPVAHQLMHDNKHPARQHVGADRRHRLRSRRQRQGAGDDRSSDAAQGRRPYDAGMPIPDVRSAAEHRRRRSDHDCRRRHQGSRPDASRHHFLYAGRHGRHGGQDHGGQGDSRGRRDG
jgi:crotonyl-CoA carboxylase/reductase